MKNVIKIAMGITLIVLYRARTKALEEMAGGNINKL